VKRLLVVVALAALTALAVGDGRARATSECRGLLFCVRVAGPWVVVPARRGSVRERVQYRLSCPRGFVVGGLDAELSDRAIDIAFLGKLGSPVGPGVTTERAATFVGTFTGSAAHATSFRPHLGCLPAAGAGGGPVPFSLPTAYPPGEPAVVRTRTVRLRPGTVRARLGCGPSEAFVSGWHAVGFYTARPPSTELAESVATMRVARGGGVTVVTRVGVAVVGVRAVLQVGAVCGGGR
jgi:hypothetical protein